MCEKEKKKECVRKKELYIYIYREWRDLLTWKIRSERERKEAQSTSSVACACTLGKRLDKVKAESTPMSIFDR